VEVIVIHYVIETIEIPVEKSTEQDYIYCARIHNPDKEESEGMVKAVYKENSFNPLGSIDLQEGEMVDIEIHRGSVVDKLYGSFSIKDTRLIEKLAESHDLE
jgi:predicted DNA-binding antitoxin AbrB/MazE fold protein